MNTEKRSSTVAKYTVRLTPKPLPTEGAIFSGYFTLPRVSLILVCSLSFSFVTSLPHLFPLFLIYSCFLTFIPPLSITTLSHLFPLFSFIPTLFHLFPLFLYYPFFQIYSPSKSVHPLVLKIFPHLSSPFYSLHRR